MADMSRESVQAQCAQFLASLGQPGFIVMGWQKPDGTYDVVQSTKEVNPVAYLKAMSWAMHEITKKI